MESKRAMFTSLSNDWETPKDFKYGLDKEFDFNYDPCPLSIPSKPHIGFDGLKQNWGTRTYCNPPYSEWQKWVKKGYEEFKKGKLIVFLLAARTDTKAFHEIILPFASEIRFIKGRLKFSGHKNSAPFASMVVIFKC